MEAVFEKTGKDAAAVVSHFETVAEVMDEVGSRLPAVGRSDVVLLMGLDGEGCSSAGWPRCQRRIIGFLECAAAPTEDDRQGLFGG